jgi:hypothetical protein
VIELLLYLFGAARGRAPRKKFESGLACPKDNQGIDPGRAPSREVQARKRHAAEYFRNFNAAGF